MWHNNAELVRQMRTMELEEIVMTIYGAAQWLYEERIASGFAAEHQLVAVGHVGEPKGLVAQLDETIDAPSPTVEQLQLLHFILWFIQEVNSENCTAGPWFNGVGHQGDEEGSMGLRLAMAFVRAFHHQLRELSLASVTNP